MWKIYARTERQAVEEMADFVRSHKNGHFMQMPCWADVKPLWNWRGICVYRDGNIVAAMGILIRPLPLGFSVLYAPRGPVCDRDDPQIWEELMEAIKKCAKKYRAIVLYTDPDEPDANEDFRNSMRQRGFRETTDAGFGNIQPQHVFRLDLALREEAEVLKAFHPKTRYNIGVAKKWGVSVREYSGADMIPDFILENFHQLMQTTGQRDHFHIRGLPYFRELLHALQEDARIYVAYLRGQPIAGAIEVFCGKKAWYLYGASSNEHRNAMPNYLLQWTMIRAALERGCEMYDFRGVPGVIFPDDPLYGLYRFKKGFGGTYTKFTGLFTFTFHPVCARVLKLAAKLRRVVCRIGKD